MREKLNRIHLGDCIEGMRQLGEGTVDLAFADPPFNIGYEYDVYEDKKEHEDYLKWSREWIAAVHQVLKPDGTFWLAIGDEYAAELKLISQEVGFHSRSWVIWYYTFGVNCKQKFTRSHAHLFHFVKDPRSFTFRGEELENRVPSARQLVYADARANSTGRLPDDTWILRPQDLVEGFTPGEDTWYIPRVAGTFKERAGFHGCQMPEQLLGRIIRICSHENEIVLDPFSGSGTTLATAKKLGRQFVGFDLSEEYVKQGSERLDSIRRGDRLNGDPEPKVSASLTKVKGDNSTRAERKQAAASAKATLNAHESNLVQLTRAGIVEAFQRVYDGFSLDRIVCDPLLNAQFVDACTELGLVGDARSWNHSLFRLRKSGELASIPTTRRTVLSAEDCAHYLFAVEIAWQKLLATGTPSLDEILADPQLAARFDAIAKSYAPDIVAPPGFSDSLCFRWAALKLRKEARDAAQRAEVLTDPQLLPERFELSAKALRATDTVPGIYIVEDGAASTLYVGEALNLREQFQFQFTKQTLAAWRAEGKDLTVRIAPLQSRWAELRGYQSRLIKTHRPKLNYNYYAGRDKESALGA